MMLFFSRCYTWRVLINLSMSFPTQLVSLIGRQLSVFARSLPFLWVGTMSASRQLWGECPVFQMLLKSPRNFDFALVSRCSSISLVIFSGPGDFLSFNVFGASSNSFKTHWFKTFISRPMKEVPLQKYVSVLSTNTPYCFYSYRNSIAIVCPRYLYLVTFSNSVPYICMLSAVSVFVIHLVFPLCIWD